MTKRRALLKFIDGKVMYANIESDIIPPLLDVAGKKFKLDTQQSDKVFVTYTEKRTTPYRMDLH